MKHQLMICSLIATLGMCQVACQDDIVSDADPWSVDLFNGEDMPPVDMAQDIASPVDESPDVVNADLSTPDQQAPVDIADDIGADMASDLKDMMPDSGILDDDFDGLSNDDELRGCTDPNNPDTDGDSIDDYSEYQQGTDPCNKDSDFDGVDDGTEQYFGLDPNHPRTHTGANDSDLFIVDACDTPESELVIFHKSNKADWFLALPTAFGNYTELTIARAQPLDSAAVYDDSTNDVSGFVLSGEPRNTTALQTLLSYKSALAQVGVVFHDLTEGEFDTHDRYRAASGEYRVRVADQTGKQVRDALLFAISPFGAADVTGLPASSGNTHTNYTIKLTVVKREDRLITLAAIAPEFLADSRDQVQFQLSDLTNTTNITNARHVEGLRCHPFATRVEPPKVDFYWVLDQSSSMIVYFDKVKGFAQDFYTQLSNTALDFRLGVTNMDGANQGRLNPMVGWHADPATFTGQIDSFVVNCAGCNGFEEHGLYAAREGIKHMRSVNASPVERIRPDAQLITVFMSDEEDQSLENLRDPGGVNTTRAQLLADYMTFFANNPLVFAVVSPGQPCSAEQGSGYQDVALASGGASASLCADDLQGTFGKMMNIAAGTASSFRLPQVPLSSTIRVDVANPSDPTTGRRVPRSRKNGYDYFPATNSIAFFGSYRPLRGGGQAIQVAVNYRAFGYRGKIIP